MKTIFRKISVFMMVVLIIGTMAVPAMAATTTTVSGGASRSQAIQLNTDGTKYLYNLRSNRTLTYFKFKTNNYYAVYELCFGGSREGYNGSLSKSVQYIFKRANNDTIETVKGEKSYRKTFNLKPNT